MNKKSLFTRLITQLLIEMANEGESPFGTDWLRTKEYQKTLFDRKLSRCDGTVKISNHQKGTALDIYMADKDGNEQYVWDKAKAKKWHDRWLELGGRPMTTWIDPLTGETVYDYGHFDI